MSHLDDTETIRSKIAVALEEISRIKEETEQLREIYDQNEALINQAEVNQMSRIFGGFEAPVLGKRGASEAFGPDLQQQRQQTRQAPRTATSTLFQQQPSFQSAWAETQYPPSGFGEEAGEEFYFEEEEESTPPPPPRQESKRGSSVFRPLEPEQEPETFTFNPPPPVEAKRARETFAFGMPPPSTPSESTGTETKRAFIETTPAPPRTQAETKRTPPQVPLTARRETFASPPQAATTSSSSRPQFQSRRRTVSTPVTEPPAFAQPRDQWQDIDRKIDRMCVNPVPDEWLERPDGRSRALDRAVCALESGYPRGISRPIRKNVNLLVSSDKCASPAERPSWMDNIDQHFSPRTVSSLRSLDKAIGVARRDKGTCVQSSGELQRQLSNYRSREEEEASARTRWVPRAW